MKNKILPINIFQSIPKGWAIRAKRAGHSVASLSRACDLSYDTVADAIKGKNITIKSADIVENKLREWGV